MPPPMAAVLPMIVPPVIAVVAPFHTLGTTLTTRIVHDGPALAPAALMSRNEASRLAAVAEQEADNARNNAQRAEQSQQETAQSLTQVESQKAAVESSLTKAEKAEQVARTAEEKGRKLLYTTDMQLAPFLWRDGRTTAEQLRVLLAKHIPEDRMEDEGGRMNQTGQEPGSSFIPHPSSYSKPDLRGFEWYYYQHLQENSASVLSSTMRPSPTAFSAPMLTW
jgi:hypothetical protein